MNSQNKDLLSSLFYFIENNNLATITDTSLLWNDEPHIPRYQATLNKNPYISYPFTSMGTSYISRELALQRCLGEFLERLSLIYLPKEKVVFFDKTLHESIYNPITETNLKGGNEKIQFLEGRDIVSGKRILVPCPYIFLGRKDSSQPLYETNSNGTAGGFSQYEALIRSIYELIERDAFMTIYLLKIPPIKISTKSIQSTTIQNLLEYCHRYKLQVSVFDITNDMQIPTFMSQITDDSGSMNFFSMGLKTSLDRFAAILGSIEEALSMRQLVRKSLVSFNKNKRTLPTNLSERIQYWLNPAVYKSMDFLSNGTSKSLSKNIVNYDNSLSLIKEILKEKDYQCVYTDLSNNIYNSLSYYVIKSFIPDLQPFYLNEQKKSINQERLKFVAKYFEKKSFQINIVPHPFL